MAKCLAVEGIEPVIAADLDCKPPQQSEMGEICRLEAAEAMFDQELDRFAVKGQVRFENNKGEVPDDLFLAAPELAGKGLELMEIGLRDRQDQGVDAFLMQ
jgi:hypothetical protein